MEGRRREEGGRGGKGTWRWRGKAENLESETGRGTWVKQQKRGREGRGGGGE